MSRVTNKSSLREAIRPRPLNCWHYTSLESRCPYCGQNHLREGYCQALDPDNAGRYPKVWAAGGGYSELVNPSHLRDEVPLLHRAETETDNEESLEINDFYEDVTGEGVTVVSPRDGSAANVTAELETRVCKECGVTFTPKRSDAMLCSAKCRQRAHRKREMERGE